MMNAAFALLPFRSIEQEPVASRLIACVFVLCAF